MIEYRPDKRLYILGGGLEVAQAIRPAAAAGGWWLSGGVAAGNCVAAYQAVDAADYAASVVNLANPGTYDLTGANAPAWAASTGWTFDGSNDTLSTGYAPGTNYVGTYIVLNYTTNAAYQETSPMFASSSGTNRLQVPAFTRGDGNVQVFHGNADTTTGADKRNTWCVSAIANRKVFQDGVTKETNLVAAVHTFYAVNIGVAPNYFKGNIAAAAIYSTTLTDEQVAAISSAMTALLS